MMLMLSSSAMTKGGLRRSMETVGCTIPVLGNSSASQVQCQASPVLCKSGARQSPVLGKFGAKRVRCQESLAPGESGAEESGAWGLGLLLTDVQECLEVMLSAVLYRKVASIEAGWLGDDDWDCRSRSLITSVVASRRGHQMCIEVCVCNCIKQKYKNVERNAHINK